jgi:hypothetical protein
MCDLRARDPTLSLLAPSRPAPLGGGGGTAPSPRAWELSCSGAALVSNRKTPREPEHISRAVRGRCHSLRRMML